MQDRYQDDFKDPEEYAQDVDGNIESLQSRKRRCCKAAHDAMGNKDRNVYAADDRMK